ncbi:CaiB/BaiF CoA-transferase family protein [Gemmobacter sp.]|uniref:CaiB/BaiF CoA transferase family protein n=1 Tax=Gemmobacter sp. TaxID=1898957 RepID=UPI002AFE4E17|nr:CaiB/BaiF CoA-transferase family protein [Gemmobacter sp.]
MTAPLTGIRIVELAGIGPGPFAGMMLADHGAEVIRIERPGGGAAGPEIPADKDILLRSRKRVEMDLKSPAARAVLLDLIASADGLIEGYRPGVLERLGLGPDVLLAANPRLVIGRMTGWGQTGPMAQMAGHDLNYIAIAGALHGVGRHGAKPVVPLNLFGDFGGGGMLLAFGMLVALTHARATGQGQVVDAAMTEGAGLLMSMLQTFRQIGIWQDDRGVNLLDGGAHFYDTYETADGKFVAIGAIEPQFYARLLDLTGLAGDPDFADQMNAGTWDSLRDRLAAIFRSRTRDDWDAVFLGTDACYAPVLSMAEAPDHPHNRARGAWVRVDGIVQAAPAPRYSHSETVPPRMHRAGTDTTDLLAGLGYDPDRIAALMDGASLG